MSSNSIITRLINDYIADRKLDLLHYNTDEFDERTHKLYHSIVAVMSAESLVECMGNRECFDNRMKARVLLLGTLDELDRTLKEMTGK